jgi:hypothetical protein
MGRNKAFSRGNQKRFARKVNKFNNLGVSNVCLSVQMFEWRNMNGVEEEEQTVAELIHRLRHRLGWNSRVIEIQILLVVSARIAIKIFPRGSSRGSGKVFVRRRTRHLRHLRSIKTASLGAPR